MKGVQNDTMIDTLIATADIFDYNGSSSGLREFLMQKYQTWA